MRKQRDITCLLKASRGEGRRNDSGTWHHETFIEHLSWGAMLATIRSSGYVHHLSRECGPRWYEVLVEASVVASFLAINELKL